MIIFVSETINYSIGSIKAISTTKFLVTSSRKVNMKGIMARLQKNRDPDKDQDKDKKVESEEKKKTKKPKVLKMKEMKISKKRKLLMPCDEKLKKPKPSSNVLIVNPKKHQKASTLNKLFKVLTATFYEYAAITKVNGMYYLRQFVTSGWLRVLWSCIMIFLLSFAATLIYLLYRRYLDSPTRVTIAQPLSISSIPFPGVTICHPQNVMEYKSKEFVKKM